MKSFAEAMKDRALASKMTSQFVEENLIRSEFKGSVLDLGNTGLGANTLPLLSKKCRVTIIDKQEAALEAFHLKECHFILDQLLNRKKKKIPIAKTILGEIATHPYPSKVDSVICIDTLPYVRPAQLKATLKKIYQALRPEGTFIGTIYYKETDEGSFVTNTMSSLGAHFYLGKAFAREMITRSGFVIIEEQQTRAYDPFYECSVLEFLAIKPAT